MCSAALPVRIATLPLLIGFKATIPPIRPMIIFLPRRKVLYEVHIDPVQDPAELAIIIDLWLVEVFNTGKTPLDR